MTGPDEESIIDAVPAADTDTDTDTDTVVPTSRPRVEPRDGIPTESRVFLSFALFYVVIGTIYAIVSDGEWAGVALLFFAAVFAGMAGLWFIGGLGPVQRDVEEIESKVGDGEVGDDDAELYLPITSIWPLGIGLGAALTGAGVAVGWPLLLPGVALLAHSVIGFASQSRRRDLG